MRETTKRLFSLLLPLALFLAAIFLFFMQKTSFPVLSGMIEKVQKEQKNSIRRISLLKNGIESKQQELTRLNKIRRMSMPPDYTDVVGSFRSRTEQIFYAAGAQVKTISTPRKLKGASGLELYEIHLTAEIRTAELVSVMESLNKPPVFLWRSLHLRPNNVINPEYININAVLGAVCFRPENDSGKGGKP